MSLRQIMTSSSLSLIHIFFNEPDGHWNWLGPKQEGTPATNREIAKAVRLVGNEFVKRGISTQLLVNESSDYRCMFATHMTDWQRGYQIQSFFSPDSVTDVYKRQMYYQYFEYPKWHNVQPHYGIRTERYKLIHYYFDIDAWELFDLQNDPNELRNLYNEPKCQELIEMLKKELYALQKEYKDDMPLEERRELTRKYMIKYSE